MNKCTICSRTRLVKEKVNIARYWGKSLVALNDVPSLVCHKCGERFFEAKVSSQIDSKIQLALREARSLPKIDVPVVRY